MVISCYASVQITRALQHLQHVISVILETELTILQENLAANHVVLGQSTCFVRD